MGEVFVYNRTLLNKFVPDPNTHPNTCKVILKLLGQLSQISELGSGKYIHIAYNQSKQCLKVYNPTLLLAGIYEQDYVRIDFPKHIGQYLFKLLFHWQS